MKWEWWGLPLSSCNNRWESIWKYNYILSGILGVLHKSSLRSLANTSPALDSHPLKNAPPTVVLSPKSSHENWPSLHSCVETTQRPITSREIRSLTSSKPGGSSTRSCPFHLQIHPFLPPHSHSPSPDTYRLWQELSVDAYLWFCGLFSPPTPNSLSGLQLWLPLKKPFNEHVLSK